MAQPKRTVSPLEHTLIGALAGVVECSLMQPTVGVKNALQEGRPVPRNPLVLYRGLVVNAGSIAPITAVQFGAQNLLERLVLGGATERPLSTGERIGTAAAAGACSSLVSCPAELVMIQQQKTGRSIAAEVGEVARAHGALKFYRALGVTMLRESIYTSSYLGLAPTLHAHLTGLPSLQHYSPTSLFLFSGITAGLFATVCTQPLDVVKTRLQGTLDPQGQPEYRNGLTAAQQVLHRQGVGGLFVGVVPRAIRIVGACLILQVVRTNCLAVLDSWHSQEEDKVGT